MRSRFVDVDQAGRRSTLALRAWMWRDGELAAEDEHLLTEQFYERDELVALLEDTGFVDVELRGGYHDGPPAPEDDMVVLLARRAP